MYMDFTSKSTFVSIIYLFISIISIVFYLCRPIIYPYLSMCIYCIHPSTHPSISYFFTLTPAVFCAFLNHSTRISSYLCYYFDSKLTTHEYGRSKPS